MEQCKLILPGMDVDFSSDIGSLSSQSIRAANKNVKHLIIFKDIFFGDSCTQNLISGSRLWIVWLENFILQ